jgi:hypothetical protein
MQAQVAQGVIGIVHAQFRSKQFRRASQVSRKNVSRAPAVIPVDS